MLPRYKDIAELVKKGATVEAQEKIMELREAALELQEENLELKERVRSLEKALSEKSKLVYEAPFYWKDNGSERDGPFCQQCYDSSEKQIRLQDNGEDYWHCFTCKRGYAGPNHKEIDLVEIGESLNGRGCW
ncbi:hypothetical protein AAEH88_19565 [Shewanella algae]|uniref:hypothetical protein n=1 Tax=Shewanella algae TaxID=38313 RepID=UPI00313C303B